MKITDIKVIFFLIVISTLCNVACRHTKTIDFNTQIRPILNDKCMTCHGGVKQQADLSFLFPEAAVLPARSGKYAIVTGSAHKSELINRIKHHNPELRMPLDDDPLNSDEIALLETWIDQGAQWARHWSYIPPAVSQLSPMTDNDWAQNEIDHFIIERLRDVGLHPSQEADKGSLMRRVSLDLIGLPPSIDDVDQYMQDDSPQAYERLVDRLLDSEHFGERWASMWLDLARYADSRGYQKDLLRPDIWRYRDWVIHAFNQDMPFDQFTIEQLAGDLLSESTQDQLLATAFHRNTMNNDEGGTDDEEFRVAAVIDRVNTTMEVWQGVTIGCVQCHSHPYDPIEHKEYYNLMAFFNNTSDSDHYRDSPTASLYSPQQLKIRKDLQADILKLENTGDTISTAYLTLLKDYLDVLPGQVPVMRELQDSSRSTHIFERGNWLVHGEEVVPGVPKSIGSLDKSYPLNRLGLAKWITSKDNPLTARVTVNRFWEQLFGQGVVTTLEDFGTQAEQPSHPELLDWLALQFVQEHRWSVKSLLKQIVMSGTYRQSSKVTSSHLEIDPYNKYLARAPRVRLSAEQIRDQALAVSGLLNPQIYGPSVMPHQPEGVWNVIRHAAKWQTSMDGAQHRRGIYTFWRRVSPYPSMISFDTPSRELCVSRRIRTNTPLQSLITLNDPVYVEAAERLANRMNHEGGADIKSQINYGYRLVLMKDAGQEQLQLLQHLYHTAKDKYDSPGSDFEEDNHILSLIQVASALLNLDEVIMKV